MPTLGSASQNITVNIEDNGVNTNSVSNKKDAEMQTIDDKYQELLIKREKYRSLVVKQEKKLKDDYNRRNIALFCAIIACPLGVALCITLNYAFIKFAYIPLILLGGLGMELPIVGAFLVVILPLIALTIALIYANMVAIYQYREASNDIRIEQAKIENTKQILAEIGEDIQYNLTIIRYQEKQDNIIEEKAAKLEAEIDEDIRRAINEDDEIGSEINRDEEISTTMDANSMEMIDLDHSRHKIY
jgi:hypothetical protein